MNDSLAQDQESLVSFGEEIVLPVGEGPVSLAIADLNGDTFLDLAVVGVGNGIGIIPGTTVSVLLGDGQGGFGPETTYDVGLAPREIVAEDFNGDGILDLAVVNAGNVFTADNTVSLLLGQGDGSFAPQITTEVGEYSKALASGDFNNDAIPDLVIANTGLDDASSGSTITVLLGDGNGTFSTPTVYEVGAGPKSVAVGDFNGDNNSDIVVANSGNTDEAGETVSVLLGDGFGNFLAPTTYEVGLYPRGVAVADLNLDSIQDLIVVNRDSDSVSILLGDGSGGFEPQQQYAVGDAPKSVAVEDLNGDSILDLAVNNIADGSVSILLGDGNGGFSSELTLLAGTWTKSVEIADLNGDNRPDIVVPNQLDNTISIFLNDSAVPNDGSDINDSQVITPAWESRLTSEVDSPVWAMTVDSDGNVYLAGRSNGSLEGASHAGDYDAWIAKYTSDGELLWLEQFGTELEDRAWEIVVDDSFIYVTGRTEGDLAGESAGGLDIFLAKYDLDGNLIWIEQFGTAGTDGSNGLSVDAAGNIYVIGLSDGLTPAGDVDIYVSIFDADGALISTSSYGIAGQDDRVYKGFVDQSGNIYATGDILVSAGDGGAAEGNITEAFVSKQDENGNLVWYQEISTPGIDRSFRVEVDADENVYVVGYTNGVLEGASAGFSDAFVAKYDPDGNLIWIDQFGTPLNDFGYGLTIYDDQIYVAGTSQFVSPDLSSQTAVSWVASYDPNGNVDWIYEIDTEYNDFLRDLAVDGDGNLYLAGFSEGLKGDPLPEGDNNDPNSSANKGAWVLKVSPLPPTEALAPIDSDFNSDGQPDFFWQNTSTGEIGIWYMDGMDFIEFADLGTVSPEWTMSGTGDFNQDGYIDLVWRNTLDGTNYVWYMEGANPLA